MRQTSIASLLLVFLLTAFSACQDEESPPEPNVRPFLISRDWRLTAYTATGSNGNLSDLYAALRTCDRDDVWRYADNNYFEKDEALVKCTEAARQVYETGTWQLNGSTLVVTLTGGKTTAYTVTEITPTTLRLQNQSDTQSSRVTYDLTFITE